MIINSKQEENHDLNSRYGHNDTNASWHEKRAKSLKKLGVVQNMVVVIDMENTFADKYGSQLLIK